VHESDESKIESIELDLPRQYVAKRETIVMRQPYQQKSSTSSNSFDSLQESSEDRNNRVDRKLNKIEKQLKGMLTLNEFKNRSKEIEQKIT